MMNRPKPKPEQPPTMEDVVRILQGEVERLRQADQLPTLVLTTFAILRGTLHTLEPCSMLVIAAALVEHLREDAHEWMTEAAGYPADDEEAKETVHDIVHALLDQVEDVGTVVAEMLLDVQPATVRATGDGILVVETPDGDTEAFELIRHTAPGPTEIN